MANQQITQLPQAQALTGAESVPIVQNGVTVQTTTGAVAGAGALNYPFLTVSQTAGLTQSRYLGTNNGLTLTDNGAQGTLQINLVGAAMSLNSSGTGIQVKTGANTVTARSIAVGAGLGITDADGVAGNPTVALGAMLQQFVSLTGTGMLALQAGSPAKVNILQTTSQTSILNGDGSGDVTVGLASNAILPGSGSVTLPQGNTGQRVNNTGSIRYNTSLAQFEGYTNTGWNQFALTGGVTSFSAGTTGFTPNTDTTGAVTLSGILNAANGGTGAATLTGYVYGNGTGVMTASTTIPNVGLANSSVTYNGVTVALGASGTITATTTGALTVSAGLQLNTGTTFDGSAARTISIDSTVVTLTGTQTLTNKTYANPVMTGAVKLTATGAGAYTPFAQTFSSSVSNFNGYQLNYIQNVNNGSDASADYVIYNDASDVESYFADFGLNSSNYSSATYQIFTPNSAYLFTGGGLSGQSANLYFGTSNAASDIVLFTGGTLLANTRTTIKGDTGNFLVGTTTDTGYKFNVGGTTYFGGASTFGSTVLLNANPTLALQAATKQYVDSAVSTGFTVHDPVSLATAAALPANTYNNGASGVGATLTAVATGVLTVDGVTATAGMRILVKNEVASANNGAYLVTVAGAIGVAYILTRTTDFDTAGAGEIANNAYFFVTAGSTNAGSSFILSQTAAITVGTTALPFSLFNDQLNYVGGTNIDVTGLTISLTGTVAATNGGTGTNTVTTGNLLYGSATNTWSKLPLGIAYKSLIVNAAGTQMEWNAIPLNQTTAVSGQLGTANGGTGTAFGVAGGAF